MRHFLRFMTALVFTAGLLSGCSDADTDTNTDAGNSNKPAEGKTEPTNTVYTVDAYALDAFIAGMTDKETVNLQVTGTYIAFINEADLLKNNNIRLNLDLSKLERPLQTFTGLKDCKSIVSIILPEGITEIGANAFNSCTSLTKIEFPKTLTTISNRAFYNCQSLDDVIIPNSVTSIGEYAFCRCTYLSKIKLSNNKLLSTEKGVFSNCISLKTLEIPNGVTSIERDAFYGCSDLRSITIPDSVTTIGWYAFSECTSLTTITIPDSVTTIGWYAFNRCFKLSIVFFEITPGWWRISNNTYSINETELQDSSNAAILLRETYASYAWEQR